MSPELMLPPMAVLGRQRYAALLTECQKLVYDMVLMRHYFPSLKEKTQESLVTFLDVLRWLVFGEPRPPWMAG